MIVNEWAWLCSNKTLFVDAEIWISYTLHESRSIHLLTFFQTFKGVQTILSWVLHKNRPQAGFVNLVAECRGLLSSCFFLAESGLHWVKYMNPVEPVWGKARQACLVASEHLLLPLSSSSLVSLCSLTHLSCTWVWRRLDGCSFAETLRWLYLCSSWFYKWFSFDHHIWRKRFPKWR